MTHEELIYKLFGQEQEEKISNHLSEIAEILSHQSEKVTIDVREVQLEDPLEKIKNPTHLTDDYLHFTENGIRILHMTDKVAEMLMEYIPRNVKELTIPSTFLKDLSFLQEFSNLETLTISDYAAFSPEEIDFIAKNTSIKNLSLRSSATFNDLKGLPDCSIIEGGNVIGRYGNLTMHYQNYNNKWYQYIKAYTPQYDAKSIATLQSLSELIKPHLENTRNISIFRDPTDPINPDFSLEFSEHKGTTLNIKNVSPTEAAIVYKRLINNLPIEKTTLALENRTYDDLYLLKEMNKKSNFTITYPNDQSVSPSATYEEFKNMRYTIDYYKELLTESGLSPVEQVAYVYDILKTMRYQENNQDKSRARNIHAIVTDGNIVCAGYAAFARQLLREIGINATNISVSMPRPDGKLDSHARNLVRIDDDKYNIHGLYAMDITWDSDKEITIIERDEKPVIVSRPNEEMKKKLIDKYDSLILYRHFLIPMETYEVRYPGEINPLIYEAYKTGKIKDVIVETRKIERGEMDKFDSKESYLIDKHQELFASSEGPLTVERYFNAKKPSLETFEEILKNVRQAQGYTQEETTHEVDRVVELHHMLQEQNPNSPNHFFKSSKTK